MNLGACYCHIVSHPGQVALLLSLGKASLVPHTEEAKAKGLTFFFHPPFPVICTKKNPVQANQYLFALMIGIVACF